MPPRHPQVDGDERTTLLAFLDYLRDAVAAKAAAGAPEPAVRTSGVPSGTNVLGLVKHLTAVEAFYFLGGSTTRWSATMHASADETVDGIVAGYRGTVARANEIIASYTDLSLPAPPRAGRGASPSMRRLLVHMIEETGRHAGHADILREQIDGAAGR